MPGGCAIGRGRREALPMPRLWTMWMMLITGVSS
jgi:hypothetical protein